jgi:hypothetical protein
MPAPRLAESCVVRAMMTGAEYAFQTSWPGVAAVCQILVTCRNSSSDAESNIGLSDHTPARWHGPSSGLGKLNL